MAPHGVHNTLGRVINRGDISWQQSENKFDLQRVVFGREVCKLCSPPCVVWFRISFGCYRHICIYIISISITYSLSIIRFIIFWSEKINAILENSYNNCSKYTTKQPNWYIKYHNDGSIDCLPL